MVQSGQGGPGTVPLDAIAYITLVELQKAKSRLILMAPWSWPVSSSSCGALRAIFQAATRLRSPKCQVLRGHNLNLDTSLPTMTVTPHRNLAGTSQDFSTPGGPERGPHLRQLSQKT